MNSILANAFSRSNDTEQGELINAFARELFVVCGGRFRPGGTPGYESQICNISRHLNADGIALIEDLHGFIQLRREEIKP